MRFLFLITHYDPVIFGAELFAKNLAEFLVRKGHEVDLVTGKWERDWKEQENLHGVVVHRVPVLKIRYAQTISSIVPLYHKAKMLTKSNKYDFIHAHIFPSVLFGYKLRAKESVITIQGGDLADYNEIYGPFAPIARPFISAALKRYTKVHAVSTDLRNQIKLLSGREAVVVSNGVDIYKKSTKLTKKAVCQKHSFVNNCVLGFSSSRLTPKNNLVETVKAIKILKDKGKVVNLLIAGSGHQLNELRELIRQLDLHNQVKLLGSVRHDQVLELVSSVDFFIRVSTCEGFGIAALEALAMKTPVISSRAGGLSDFINSENAFIPKNHKAPAIAATIIDLIENQQLIGKKVQNAFSMVEKSYQWNTVLKRFAKLVYGIN